MNYDGWLFIDHDDLKFGEHTVNDWKSQFPGCMVKGSRQKLEGDWEDVTHLSVQYTPVGHTILDRCPNLKWVLVRAHATHVVNFEECKKRGIGVARTAGYTKNCAKYILNHLDLSHGPILFYGYGAIAMAVDMEVGLKVPTFFTSKSREDFVKRMLCTDGVGTIVATVPPTYAPEFNRGFFLNLKGQDFISICHKPVMDNWALLDGLNVGALGKVVIDDMKDDGAKEKILSFPNVTYTHESAWKTDFNQVEYYALIKKAISEILDGTYENIMLRPRPKVSEGFDI